MIRRFRQFIVLVFLMLSFSNVRAQYINADSLIQLPGYDHPVTVNAFNDLVHDVTAEDPDSWQEILFGQYVPVGYILRHFVLPCDGKLISKYGMRSGRMHTGTDLKMPKGDTIYAVYQGVVTRSSYYYGYGNMVVLDHGSSIETGYAHLSAFLVKAGDTVKRNQPIGLAGSTGRSTTSHLHFELKEAGKFFDPELVFDFHEKKVRDEVYHVNALADLRKDLRQNSFAQSGNAPQKYIVASGDSLWKISRRFKTSVDALCELNNLSKNSVLNVGMELQLFR